MNPGDSSAIILAAGLSSRSRGFKPLLPLGDKTILDRVISIFQQNRVNVILVAGYRGEELKEFVRSRGIDIVENPDFEQGMFTSVQAGVRRLGKECKDFFIMPVDIPLVRPETISRLLIEAEKIPGRIIYPVFGGRRGHPPLVHAGLIPQILAWNGDGGLKAVLATHSGEAIEVPVPDSNILFDVDTPEDYEELTIRFLRYDIPTDEECRAVLDICKVVDDIRQHSEKVMQVAVKIGETLNVSGHAVDVEAIRAAARLHDIAKGKSEHDAEGGKILKEMGFGPVGDIVAVHTDLAGSEKGHSLEARVVYLADKYVNGIKLVTVESRYDSANSRFGVTPEIESAIARRRAIALNVKQEFESWIGESLDSVILVR